MQPDKFTCKSTTEEEPFLIFTNRYDIRLVNLGSDLSSKPTLSGKGIAQTSIPLLSQLRNTIAVDFYYENASSITLFWSDIQKDQIFRGRINSGVLVDVKPIVKVGIWTAEGLAVDWIGKNVYWVDSLLDQIQVVNFEGTFSATVLKYDMHNLRALALDPTKGLMFWTDWQEENPRIERATMAGTDRRLLFKVLDLPDGGWPNGLTCDYVSERVYWIDAKSDSVHTITYDGEDYRLILRDAQNMAHPFAISIFESHIYWTDWRNTNIYRANKWNGSEVTLIEDTNNQPFDLKVVHSSRQPKGIKNPCRENNGGCSHLCLIESKTTKKCFCPHMMALDNSQKSCYPINQTLIFATSTTVTAIEIDRPNAVVFPLLAPKADENISALATDPRKTTIFWSDLFNGRIYKLQMQNSSMTEQEVLLKSGADNCYGLSVDPAQGLLYFTGWKSVESNNATEAWISVITVDGKYKKTIVSSRSEEKLKKPVQINYIEGELYWFDIGYSPPALFRSSASGKKMAEINLKGLSNDATVDPSSLIIDNNKRLFWTQPTLNKVRVLELSSMTLHTMNTSSDPLKIPALIALDDDAQELIFYDKGSGDILARMVSTNYYTGGKPFELRKSSRLLRSNNTNLVAMKIMDRSAWELELQNSEEEPDQCESMKCDQICIRSFKDHKCICADGYIQDSGKCKYPDKKLIYVDSNGELFWQSTDNQEGKLESTNLVLSGNEVANVQPRRIEVDSKKDRIYMIDSKLNELFMINLTDSKSSMRKLFSGGTSRLSGLAIDPVHGYIFVSSFLPMSPGRHLSGNIHLLHPDSEDIRTIVFRKFNDTISNLVIDPAEGWLFWLSRTGIMKCRYDGSSSSQIVKDNPLISLLTIDLKRKRLIFTYKMSTMASVDYSGKDEKELRTSKTAYDTIEVFDGVLYYSVRKQFYRAEFDENNGSIMNETVKNLGGLKAQLKDLKGYDRTFANSLSNPCSENNGGCEQICYFLGPSNNHKCGCVFSKLSKDKRSCEHHRAFMAYVRGSVAFAPTYASLDTPEDHLSVSTAIEQREFLGAYKPITDPEIIRAPVAIAADYDRFQLILSDIKANRLVAIKIDQSDYFVIAQDVKQVEGIAFDEKHRDIYFTSGPSIMRVSLLDKDKSKYPKKASVILELSEYDKPRGIAVDPCQM